MTELPPVKQALLLVEEMHARLDAAERERSGPVAIVGLGCRFPQGETPEEYWRLLVEGRDALREVPADRWDAGAFYDPDPERPGKIASKWGCFLDRVDEFDARFFGISPREAVSVDPQQRLLLEVAWEALEDAGTPAESLAGSNTGVFIGLCNNDYAHLQSSEPERVDVYTGVGISLSVSAGRLSYAFDFRGPSLIVDTACSSSLTALHLACQSLRTKECDVAVAGAVALMLAPLSTLVASRMGLLAADGRCKTFDRSADGFVRGEGCGVVVLKRLSDAVAAGDRILALIRGSAVSQDGRNASLAAPNPIAQEAVIRQAQAAAGITPGDVGYIEAHGTATALGDPIEMSALAAVFGDLGLPERSCAVASVKTNLGHLEAAAGMAGLIKTVFALRRGVIPPHLNFEVLSPHISLESTPFYIPTRLTDWPAGDRPRVAGISSFGWAGTIAHVVVEEYRAASAVTPQAVTPPDAAKVGGLPGEPASYLLPLSAKTPAALRDLAAAFASHLGEPVLGSDPDAHDGRAGRPDVPAAPLPAISAADLLDICYTAGDRRSRHDFRAAVWGSSPADLTEALAAGSRGEAHPRLAAGRSPSSGVPSTVFVFPGHGAQRSGMGQELYRRSAAFRAAISEIDAAIAPLLGRSLGEWFEQGGDPGSVALAQPLLFALQVGLAAVWREWGITPDAVVGHSMGEVAAAYVAGALALNDACLVVAVRSELLAQLSGRGAMAMVELSPERAAAEIAPYGGRLVIAAYNGPEATVLAGEPEPLAELLAKLEVAEVFCRPIKVEVASHSPLVDPLLGSLVERLSGLQPRDCAIPFYSTVGGESPAGAARLSTLPDSRSTQPGGPVRGSDLDSQYWASNLREPVNFLGVSRRLAADEFGIALELSPHPLLTVAMTAGYGTEGKELIALPSLRKDTGELAALTETLGVLYAHGLAIRWRSVFPGGRPVSLPAYPWQREHFWIPDMPRRQGGTAAPLLVAPPTTRVEVGSFEWETTLDTKRLPYLADHRVGDAVIVPAAAYVELVLQAASQVFGSGAGSGAGLGPSSAAGSGTGLGSGAGSDSGAGSAAVSLEAVELERALAIGDAPRAVWVRLTVSAPGKADWQIVSGVAEGEETCHARGRLIAGTVPPPEPQTIPAPEGEALPGADFYEALGRSGLNYGPAFVGIERLWPGDGEALGKLRATDAVRLAPEGYRVHPALLDACFQVLGAAAPPATAERTYLPVGFERLTAYGAPAGELWARARLRPTAADAFAGDVWLLDGAGNVLVEARGLRVRALEGTGGQEDWFFGVAWESRPLEPRAEVAPGSWLIAEDAGGLGKWLAAQLQSKGHSCVLLGPGEDVGEALAAALGPDRPPCRAVVYLRSLDGPAASEAEHTIQPDQALQSGCLGALAMVQALAGTPAGTNESPRLYLVSRLAEAAGDCVPSPFQAPLWGFGRVAAYEHPELRPTLVDLALADESERLALLAELLADDAENQVALRSVRDGDENQSASDDTRNDSQSQVASHNAWSDGESLVASGTGARSDGESLVVSGAGSSDGESPVASGTGPNDGESLVASGTGQSDAEDQPARSEPRQEDVGPVALQRVRRYVPRLDRLAPSALCRSDRPVPAGDRPYRLEIDKPGLLDRLVLREAARREPSAGEAEVKIEASGLNYLDVLGAMGVRPDLPAGEVPVLGIECSGVVTRVGPGTDGFSPGDRVVAIGAGCLGTHVTTSPFLLARRPTGVDSTTAAGLPIAYLTAYYALIEIGRLTAGERVLIHSAAGGTGLAAVRIAQWRGAEVFATAGSPEKREFLRTLGIRHVFDSRTPDFAREVLKATAGAGVDVVLNSLAGEFIDRSLSVLGRFGRFLEIGKADRFRNSRLGLGHFKQNQAYLAIDIGSLLHDRPAICGRILREVLAHMERGRLPALPQTAFPLTSAPDAFRHMALARHIGKVVLTAGDRQTPIIPAAPRVRPDGWYLVTGGLGGIGIEVARHLVEQGATHVLLLGRHSPDDRAAQAIDAMRGQGARIEVVQADVADRQALESVLESALASVGDPLRGVFHAAGVLDDGLLASLDERRFRQVLAPKVDGAWNLHLLTRERPLDFFVLFSSAAALLGSSGQANYAAANAFLGALAHYRRASGLPAQSIDWGPWAEVGLAAARTDRGERVAARGLGSFSVVDGLAALDRLMAARAVQAAVLPLDLPRWFASYPEAARAPFFARLASPAAATRLAGKLRDELLGLDAGARTARLGEFLVGQLATILRLTPDEFDRHRPLTMLGIDSLMAVELRNRIDAELGVHVPMVRFLEGPSISQLAERIGGQLPASGKAFATASATASAPASLEALVAAGDADLEELLGVVDQLSDDEVGELLATEQRVN